MNVRSRLIFLGLSLGVLLLIGRGLTGSFEFFFSQFWFASGFFLLLLLSLIDQPTFSRDAHLFLNGVIALTSLLLVPPVQRDSVWVIFLAWSLYLVVTSYALMWLRSQELRHESSAIQFISRVNRQIGRPEAIFSAFFLWGAILQFGTQPRSLGLLFVFWAVFMILNVPSIAATVDAILAQYGKPVARPAGVIHRIVSPWVADALMSHEAPVPVIGRSVDIKVDGSAVAARAVIIDDRLVSGQRVGRLAIKSVTDSWVRVGRLGARSEVWLCPGEENEEQPISVVDAGTEIGKLAFVVSPQVEMQSGEVLWTQREHDSKVYYQVISAIVAERPMEERNALQTVKVIAGELGQWDEQRARFEPLNWVAPAGQLIYRVSTSSEPSWNAPEGNAVVGIVPNSDFPVHVKIEDIVTHNTAIVGVTGSGKSFLAFHLIEEIIGTGVKVLILDISRQHDIYLNHLEPTALRAPAEVAAWFDGPSLLGIHQYALDAGSFPKTTADFVQAALAEVSKARLERGRNIPARLCIVFEEAHSLVPEWNQVAQDGDKNQVNRTARAILQGRKFGLGALIITQRTANVTKTILNQCNTIFALQSFDQTGLDFLRNYMGAEYSEAISTLPARHAILVGKASSSARPLLFRVEDMEGRWVDPRLPTDEDGSGATTEDSKLGALAGSVIDESASATASPPSEADGA